MAGLMGWLMDQLVPPDVFHVDRMTLKLEEARIFYAGIQLRLTEIRRRLEESDTRRTDAFFDALADRTNERIARATGRLH